MLRNLTKGWYLRCYKYQRRNLNVYSNIYSRESSFLLSGIRQSGFIMNQTNKRNIVFRTRYFKQDRYFVETNKKSVSKNAKF